MIKLIGIDFDGTLGATQKHHRDAEDAFFALIEEVGASPEQVAAVRESFFEFEKRNLHITGYGVGLNLKTTITLALEHVPELIDQRLLTGINNIAEELRFQSFEIFEDVENFLQDIAALGFKAAIITKGEIHHQRDKLQRLEDHVGERSWRSYVIGDKTESDYRKILRAEGVSPDEFIMIGDSVTSDINPVIKMGGKCIHIARPCQKIIQWEFDKAQLPRGVETVATLTEAMGVLKRLVANHDVAPKLHLPRRGGLGGPV